jgi:hypothetical protein
MPYQTISCPKCSEEITLDDALTRQIIDKEVEGQVKKEREILSKSIKQESERKFNLDKDKLNEQLKEKDASLKKLENAELEARKFKNKLDDKIKSFEDDVEDKTREIRGKLETDYKQKFNDELEKSHKESIKFEKIILDEKEKATGLEIKFLKEQQKATENKMEYDRKFVSLESDLKVKITKQVQNDQQQQLGEKEKVIKDLTVKIRTLRDQAEQGSQQLQGEVSEQILKQKLNENFYEDLIEDVPDGVKGADIVQTIKDQGRVCGIILWESKNTVTWQKSWIDKLKTDQKNINANFSVLVSKTLPPEIPQFGDVQNVWVTGIDLVVPLAKILRGSIIELHQKKQSLEGTNLKMVRLYEFINSPQFRQRLDENIDNFIRMNDELDKEMRFMKKMWEKRKAIINQMSDNYSFLDENFKLIVSDSTPQMEGNEKKLLESTENNLIDYVVDEENGDLGIKKEDRDDGNSIKVIVGDTVKLNYMGVPFTVIISSGNEDDPSSGIFNKDHENAKSLLGKHVGQKVRVELSEGIFNGAKIIKIIR